MCIKFLKAEMVSNNNLFTTEINSTPTVKFVLAFHLYRWFTDSSYVTALFHWYKFAVRSPMNSAMNLLYEPLCFLE